MSEGKNPSPEALEVIELLEEEPAPLSLYQKAFRSSLPEAVIRDLNSLARVQEMKPGEPLFHEGEEGKEWGVILAGEAEVRGTFAGRMVVLHRLKAGEIVGEVAVLNKVPRTATVVAVTPLKVALFPAERLQELVNRYPSFSEAMERTILERAEETAAKVREATSS